MIFQLICLRFLLLSGWTWNRDSSPLCSGSSGVSPPVRRPPHSLLRPLAVSRAQVDESY